MKAFCLGLLFLIALPTMADTDTGNWGLGVGLGGIFYPHYPGADEEALFVAPFPNIEYYGEKFTLDRRGLVAQIFQSDRFNLKLSAGGSLPVNADDNQARNGMDDLELIFEIGPSLQITLLEKDSSKLRLDIPLRAAIEMDFSELPSYTGFTFDPKIHFEFARNNWEWQFETGALFGSKNYHEIYYQVDPEFVTEERSAYTAKRGLTGWRSSIGAKYQVGNWKYFGYTRYLNFDSAANKDSPLLRQNDYFSVGIAVIWMLRSANN